MTTPTIQPTNKSFLSNNKFQFVITRLPNVEFFVQSANLPAMTLLNTDTQTPFTRISVPGNILIFDPLTVTYIMDENMQSWFEIYNWITQLGNPTNRNKIGNLTQLPGAINSITSDATLTINTNSNNPNIRITFKDLYPTELSGVQFTSIEGQDFLTASITFAYTTYTAVKL
jgi:hypothetical protein